MPLSNNFFNQSPSNHGWYKKLATVVALIFLTLLIAVIIIWGYKSGWFSQIGRDRSETPGTATSAPSNLGSLPGEIPGEEGKSASSTLFADDIERIYFSDFYRVPSRDLPSGLAAVSTPINIKTDVINYHDVSRKLDLSTSVDSLNSNGFALLDNPWSKEASDYYSIFAKLQDREIPMYISSDFLFSYYHRSLQQAYKDVESEIFYQSLWNFSHSMYERSKLRYENRLAAIGQVNDSLLEAERMETAFFAVTLSLLSPGTDQITGKNLNDKGLFSPEEARRFSFTPVPYISSTVYAEEKLIESAKPAKSPVFLYDMDYSRFQVPSEYQETEKLRNFYLSSSWLNSVFPTNYASDACSDCLLDRDDWRIGFIASQLVVSDMYSDASLKKEWAKVYKMMSFFSGLKDEYDYVKYHAALASVFGDDYQADAVFESRNEGLDEKLDQARAAILSQKLLGIGGGEIQGRNVKAEVGFKMLTDSYSASEIISSSLSLPLVGLYLGKTPSKNNVTVCAKDGAFRCNGFSLDALSLAVDPIGDSWQENTNYQGYAEARQALALSVQKDAVWQNSNYWFTLQLIKDYYESSPTSLGAPYSSFAWREKMQSGAQAMWTMMQLVPDSGSIRTETSQASPLGGNSTAIGMMFEPSLIMVRDMIAGEDMVISMLSSLGIDSQARAVSLGLMESKEILTRISGIIEKQMQGNEISPDDEEFIRTWISGWQVKSKSNKQLIIGERNEKKAYVIEDIGNLKLAVITQVTPAGTKLFVGPTVNHKESR